jgi:hypothetical protein
VDETTCQEVFVAWPAGECRGLLDAESPSLNLRSSKGGLAELVELG